MVPSTVFVDDDDDDDVVDVVVDDDVDEEVVFSVDEVGGVGGAVGGADCVRDEP
jgi:hypothetical protein